MILLSALLASLTGLVSGERQPVRAQVELSAAVAAVQAEAAQARPAAPQVQAQAIRVDRGVSVAAVAQPARIATIGVRLATKQSWLI